MSKKDPTNNTVLSFYVPTTGGGVRYYQYCPYIRHIYVRRTPHDAIRCQKYISDSQYYLFLDYSDKFPCIIAVPNFKDENVPKFHVGNVPKFHIGNVPNFEVGNVPNLKLGNCIQSIITPPGYFLLS